MDLISANTEQAVSSSITNLRNKPTSYGSSIVSRDAGVRFYSTGSSTYNSRSNRQLTIKLSSTAYIDAATACLCFQLKPGSNVGQVPESDFALACFQSATLRVGGRTVEDIQNFNDIARPLFYMGTNADVVKTTPGHYKFNRVNSAILNVSNTGVVSGANALNSGLTDAATFDGGAGAVIPGVSGTLPNNASLLLTASGNLQVPEGAAWVRTTSDSAYNNRCVQGPDGRGRMYCLPLKHIFGLFRSESFIPLRNLQSIQIDLVLTDYAKCFINPCTYTSGANLTVDTASFTNVALEDYSIISPYISVDVVQPSEGTVSLIDERCASPEGIAILYDSYSTQKQTVQYGTSINLQTAKAYSHVRDSYCFLTPSQVNTGSTCLDLSNQYLYGTRVQSHQTSVGSSNFPIQYCDNSADSLFQLKKALGHHDAPIASVLDHNMYLGLNPGGVDEYDKAFFPSLDVASKQNTSDAYRRASVYQAALLPFAPNSLYCIGASFEKSISKGGKSLSGVNTRLTSSQINININMRDVNNNTATDVDSAVGRYSLDCIAGRGPITTIVAVHFEALLVVQSNNIVVAD
jgi:hypothetical protein